MTFRTKPQIALAQLRPALAAGVPKGVVAADAGYGNGAEFRDELKGMGLRYAAGVLSTTRVWAEGRSPLPPRKWSGHGRPPPRLRRAPAHRPATAKELALENEARFRYVSWRGGTRGKLRGRFLALRVRSAHRDYQRRGARDEERVVVEWPESAPEPTKYFLSTLPPNTSLGQLIRRVKLRWRIERDYQELKQELGLTRYEGRGWRGFHHHATLAIAAYAFLVAERGRSSPSGAGGGTPQLKAARVPRGVRPRGSPAAARAACAGLDRLAAHMPQHGAGAYTAPLSGLSASQHSRSDPQEDL